MLQAFGSVRQACTFIDPRTDQCYLRVRQWIAALRHALLSVEPEQAPAPAPKSAAASKPGMDALVAELLQILAAVDADFATASEEVATAQAQDPDPDSLHSIRLAFDGGPIREPSQFQICAARAAAVRSIVSAYFLSASGPSPLPCGP